MNVPDQANTKLIKARLQVRSPTGSGHPMSRQELAEAVNTWQWHAYVKEDRLDETDIGRLERGDIHWPGRLRREGFRAVLSAQTDAELGFYRYRQTKSRVDTSAVTHLAGPVHHVNGFPPKGCREADLVELTSSLDHRGMTDAELTDVELVCERVDRQFAQRPPDELLTTVRTLMTHVSSCLRQQQTLRHHERLVILASRLAGLRAWACFDIDEHSEADRWYEVAVTAAHEARAWGLGAWLLGAQSLIPWHRRDLGRTVALIERGIYFAGQGSDATTRAWLHALHARGHAAKGNHDGFDTSYALALESAEYSNERDRRHGMDFADSALDLRYYSGTSRLLLNQPDRAHPELTGSLDALPPSHTKARAVLRLFLADAAIQSGDASRATKLTQQALTSTIEQPIVPILQQARRVRRLVHQCDPGAGKRLDEQIHQFSGALSAVAGRSTA